MTHPCRTHLFCDTDAQRKQYFDVVTPVVLRGEVDVPSKWLDLLSGQPDGTYFPSVEEDLVDVASLPDNSLLDEIWDTLRLDHSTNFAAFEFAPILASRDMNRMKGILHYQNYVNHKWKHITGKEYPVSLAFHGTKKSNLGSIFNTVCFLSFLHTLQCISPPNVFNSKKKLVSEF